MLALLDTCDEGVTEADALELTEAELAGDVMDAELAEELIEAEELALDIAELADEDALADALDAELVIMELDDEDTGGAGPRPVMVKGALAYERPVHP
jgi:hypothetical protein